MSGVVFARLTDRARALLLVNVCAWLVFSLATVNLFFMYSSPLVQVGVILVELALAFGCGVGVIRTFEVSRERQEHREFATTSSWQEVVLIQDRIGAYVSDAVAHVVVVPLLLLSVSVLLVLALSPLPRATPTLSMLAFLFVGLVLIAIGSLRTAFGLLREARRLAHLNLAQPQGVEPALDE